jgi:MFS family permease
VDDGTTTRPAADSRPSRDRGPLLRALRHRNYRLFFTGQSISLVGTWITRVATSWLVYRLTHSATMLGVVGFAGQIPAFLLAPFAGVWVDRLDRYRVLKITQTLAMLQSMALAALTLSGAIRVWHILLLQAFQGLINAFDMPARQSFVVEMVDDRDDLPNAIALNSSMVNAARLVGPSLAGLLIAGFGEGWCFLLDGMSYIAVLVSLSAMRLHVRTRVRSAARLRDDLRDGFGYGLGFPPIRAVLLLLAVASLMGMPYTILMPIVADRTLHGGPHTLGFLMGASGVGALGGAFYLASRRSVVGLGRVIATVAGMFGVSLVAFSLSNRTWLSLVLLFGVGAGFMIQMAGTNTVLQTLVREEMRGRVMSLYTMAFMGMAPFGSLLLGAVAAHVGAPEAIRLGGTVCVIGAIVFALQLPRLREHVRPLYVERGILPQVAAGLGSATTLEEGIER